MRSVLEKLPANQRQLFSFILVGGGATLLNWLVSATMVGLLGSKASVAGSIGYFVGFLAGYRLNKTVTFDARDRRNRDVFLPYLGVYAFSFLLSYFLLDYINASQPLEKMLSIMAVTVVTMACNFLGTKLLIFKK